MKKLIIKISKFSKRYHNFMWHLKILIFFFFLFFNVDGIFFLAYKNQIINIRVSNVDHILLNYKLNWKWLFFFKLGMLWQKSCHDVSFLLGYGNKHAHKQKSDHFYENLLKEWIKKII